MAAQMIERGDLHFDEGAIAIFAHDFERELAAISAIEVEVEIVFAVLRRGDGIKAVKLAGELFGVQILLLPAPPQWRRSQGTSLT